jgi:xanthine permease XanP
MKGFFMVEEKKSIVYSVNQVPPPGALIALSIQHVFLMFMSLCLPILFCSQMGSSADFAVNIIACSMLAAGLGSIIQSVGLPYIGSGYLCPNVCGPSYFSLSISAAWLGGLPLMRGMIIITGLCEMAMAPVLEKLKKIFPSFIVGLVVAMVGVSIVKISVSSFFGASYEGDGICGSDIFVGIISLLTMILCSLWGNAFLKKYCLLAGMLLGWYLAVLFHPEYWHELNVVGKMPVVAFPRIPTGFMNIRFDIRMLIPFLVISIGGSLKSFGNLLAIQKISLPDLKEPDFTPIRKGLLADGFSTALAGLLGGMAVDTSSSNVGVAGATKAVSRWISVGAGTIFTLLAFFPKLAYILSSIPKPVLGASIAFSGCFMLCIGFRQMFINKWDAQKTFVVGTALIFGLSTAFLPGLYARAPHVVQVFFTDPLPTTTILAVVLNLFFNLNFTMKKIFRKV